MSLFHFISLAEQSGHCNRRQAAVCFPKSKPKRRRRGEWVHFHHDTRPLQTRLVTLPPLQTKPHGGITSGSGGRGKTIEMGRWWWWWRENNRKGRWWWWRENNRNEEVEKGNKKHWGGKIIKIVEKGIKTLRRENNKIVEKGIKKIEERNKIEKGEG